MLAQRPWPHSRAREVGRAFVERHAHHRDGRRELVEIGADRCAQEARYADERAVDPAARFSWLFAHLITPGLIEITCPHRGADEIQDDMSRRDAADLVDVEGRGQLDEIEAEHPTLSAQPLNDIDG